MTNRKINITISGGANSFGDINQTGDTKIVSKVQVCNIDESLYFEKFYSEIGNKKFKSQINPHDIELLKSEIQSIQSASDSKDNVDNYAIIRRIKAAYDAYKWAAEPLKKLFDNFCPGWDK